MKRMIVTLAAVAAGLAAAPSFAKAKVPMAGPPGAWVPIGTAHAQHLHDHDTIFVTGPGDHFRAIRLKVTDAPLRMHRMRVIYANGAPEEVPLRFNFAQGSMSRVINLRGGDRNIRQIDFWYDTKGWLKGTADVTLYGMH